MLQTLNNTPFEVGLSLVTDQHGAELVNIAVKGTFGIPKGDCEIVLAEEQLPVLYTDEHYGDPEVSSIKYPVDLVLGKVSTDIGLVGTAHSPNGKPVNRLPVSLRVGQLNKTILVTGDRFWKKRPLLPGFYISEPKHFRQMPLRYERAYGGMDLSHTNDKKHGGDDRNPIGTGFRLHKEGVRNQMLPNLENPENLISHWKDRPPIACFGFTNGSWVSRRDFAGTYNDEWRENQFPLLPKDFDLRYFNSAAPGLITNGFLAGGESVQLVNLAKREKLEFRLPKLDISLMYRLGETRNHEKARIWTVVFEPDQDRFYMVWGSAFRVGKQPSRMRYVKVEMAGEPELFSTTG